MTEKYGIDVSEYQGVIDWDRVIADGKSFAILRCGYGRYSDQRDTRFEANYSGAKAAGLPVGTYLFSYAVTVEQARQEAENCLSLISGKQFEYPIVYDVESPAQANLSRELLTEIVSTFCSAVQSAGYYVSIYANLNFITNKLDMDALSEYAVWLAQWGTASPSYTRNVGMWQYSATGRVDGIVGDVDLDVAYKDYPSIIKAAGLNGYVPDDSTGDDGSNPGESAPAAGDALVLSNVAVYSTSRTRIVSLRVNGTYYLYDGRLINGRYRITNRRSKVGRRPIFLFVTGWINAADAQINAD